MILEEIILLKESKKEDTQETLNQILQEIQSLQTSTKKTKTKKIETNRSKRKTSRSEKIDRTWEHFFSIYAKLCKEKKQYNEIIPITEIFERLQRRFVFESDEKDKFVLYLKTWRREGRIVLHKPERKTGLDMDLVIEEDDNIFACVFIPRIAKL